MLPHLIRPSDTQRLVTHRCQSHDPRHTCHQEHAEPKIDADADEVIIIDWETIQRSIGVSDIAYLMFSSMLPVEQRRRYEAPVIAAYHDELLASGVTAYSLDDCHDDYRLSIVGLLSMAIAPPFIKSCAPAFQDWDCAVLVPGGEA